MVFRYAYSINDRYQTLKLIDENIYDNKIDQILQLRLDLTNETVCGQVEGLQICVVGNEGRDRAADAEACKAERENPLIVAGHAFKLRDGVVAGRFELVTGPLRELGFESSLFPSDFILFLFMLAECNLRCRLLGQEPIELTLLYPPVENDSKLELFCS